MNRILAPAIMMVVVILATSGSSPFLAAAAAQSGGDNTIMLRPVGPAGKVTIQISDSDLNINPNRVDRFDDAGMVEFRTDRSEVGEASPDIEETGPSTGVFEFTVELETDETACSIGSLADPEFAAEGGSDPSVGVCPGDVLLVRYEDNRGASGGSEIVNYVVEIKSWDPEFVADRDFYQIGDRAAIEITDPDANRDPDVADTIKDIRVFSESDRAGQRFSAIETGRDTGVFKLSFNIASESQGNAIVVTDYEEVTVEYEDDFPANFDEGSRVFSFVMVVPVEHGGLAVTPSRPEVRNAAGTDELAAGQQLVLAMDLTNNNDDPQPFMSLVEVRDATGITLYLGWQSGTLNPEGQSKVGFSWVANQPGDYEVRTFVITDMQNPQVLSPVESTIIVVS